MAKLTKKKVRAISGCDVVRQWLGRTHGRPAGFAKSAEGVVHLRGALDGGTIDQVAFTLPAGFRPATDVVFPSISGAGSFGAIVINPDGDVSANGGSNLAVNLDGMTFPAG